MRVYNSNFTFNLQKYYFFLNSQLFYTKKMKNETPKSEIIEKFGGLHKN